MTKHAMCILEDLDANIQRVNDNRMEIINESEGIYKKHSQYYSITLGNQDMR
jgi:hypothetical protein